MKMKIMITVIRMNMNMDPRAWMDIKIEVVTVIIRRIILTITIKQFLIYFII